MGFRNIALQCLAEARGALEQAHRLITLPLEGGDGVDAQACADRLVVARTAIRDALDELASGASASIPLDEHMALGEIQLLCDASSERAFEEPSEVVAMVRVLRDSSEAYGLEQERDAIVGFVRRNSDALARTPTKTALHILASEIERGEHLKGAGQ